MKCLLLSLLCAAFVARSAAAVVSDIEYGRADNESLRLDACVPEGAGPFAAVILVHGGGWMGGDKKTNCAALFEPLTHAGLAWFSVNYRLAPQHRYPACVEDVETAILWVKAHAAEYRVDPKRIALLGESAGGHIVQMVAVRAKTADAPTHLAALVPFYAPCDNVADSVRRGGPSKSMQALLGVGEKLDAPTEAKLWEISPLNFVHTQLPPCLLVHGTADKSVPYEQSLQWQARLRSLHVPCELITIEGGPHVMDRWETIDPTYKEKTVAWLVRTLTPAAPK
jgi:acetyl esterase